MQISLPVMAFLADVSQALPTGQFLSRLLVYTVAAGAAFLASLYVFNRARYLKVYCALEKFTQHNTVRPAAAIITVLVGGYFTVKKAFVWSMSEWLDSVFHTTAATSVSFFLLLLVVVAVAVNALNVWFEHHPGNATRKVDPEGISQCILKINNEIHQHCERLSQEHAKVIRTRLMDGHAFKENIGLVVDSLHEHAKSSLKGFKARRRDIFVSVYQVPNFQDPHAARDELVYMTHFPLNRDSVGTKRISLNDPQFQAFACVRCIKSGQEFISSLDCADYAHGSGKRTNSVRHYFGFAIRAEDRLLGFVNIELHNEQFFTDQDQLDEYAENHLIVFKYLIAYQFLKAVFFKRLERHLPEANPQSATA